MSRYAAVDVGTNSVRLLIADEIEGKIRPVRTELRFTRLGEGVSQSGVLKPEAISRTVAALQEYKELIDSYRVDKVSAVATSAVRDAGNSADFLSHVFDETGILVRVIRGEEEAALSYLGAVSGLTINDGVPVVVDIGGGSTEINWKQGNDFFSYSINVGAVRLTEEPKSPEEILLCLKPVLNQVKNINQARLVGVGGTITTLAAVDQKLEVYRSELVHGYVLPVSTVDRILTNLSEMDIEERRQVAGLQLERADIIVPGILILRVILNYLKVLSITVSESDILHGIILRLVEKTGTRLHLYT